MLQESKPLLIGFDIQLFTAEILLFLRNHRPKASWEMFTFKSSKGLAASDVIRSMKRLGFANDEIYDVLTGVGLSGEQVQLLIERVSAEFDEAKLEPRTSRLAVEVQRIFNDSIMETKSEISTKMNALSDELQLIRSEIEKLSNRIVDLQSIIDRSNFFTSIKSRGKLPSRLRRC